MQSSTVYRPIHHLRESRYGRPSMENIGERIAQRLSCDKTPDPIAALRAKSPEEIIQASKPALAGLAPSSDEGTPFEPIVDGWVIPDDPSDLFDAGKQYNIPLIAGTNADEGTLFIQKMPVRRPLLMRMIVKKAFPDYADEIFKIFKFNTPEQAYDSMNQIFGDMCSTAPMRATVGNMEKIGSNSWLYHFTHARSDFLGKKFGAWHGSEIRFVFNSLDRGNTRVTEADRELAKIISGCWVRFAATGSPNGFGLPKWPSYDSVKKPYLEFGDSIEVKQGLNEVSCNLFEKVEKTRRANSKRSASK
jgi:para-nitrobenzyl esterase